MFELIVVWYDGSKDIFEYDTREQAETAGHNMTMAMGNQIFWYGVRRKF